MATVGIIAGLATGTETARFDRRGWEKRAGTVGWTGLGVGILAVALH